MAPESHFLSHKIGVIFQVPRLIKLLNPSCSGSLDVSLFILAFN